MNLRLIKKDIEYYIGEFIDDCTLFVTLNPGCDTTGIDKVINASVDLYNDLREKINSLPEELKAKAKTHEEKAGKTKKLNAYYSGIRKELFEKLDDLSEELSGVITKEIGENAGEAE